MTKTSYAILYWHTSLNGCRCLFKINNSYIIKNNPFRVYLWVTNWIQHNGKEGTEISRVNLIIFWADVAIVYIFVIIIVVLTNISYAITCRRKSLVYIEWSINSISSSSNRSSTSCTVQNLWPVQRLPATQLQLKQSLKKKYGTIVKDYKNQALILLSTFKK